MLISPVPPPVKHVCAALRTPKLHIGKYGTIQVFAVGCKVTSRWSGSEARLHGAYLKVGGQGHMNGRDVAQVAIGAKAVKVINSSRSRRSALRR